MSDVFDDPDTTTQLEDDDPEQLAGDVTDFDPTSDDPDGTDVQAHYDGEPPPA